MLGDKAATEDVAHSRNSGHVQCGQAGERSSIRGRRRPASLRTQGEGHVPSILIVAQTEADARTATRDDRRTFQLKERVSASDVNNAHFSAQLMERIGWALADAEAAEQAGKTSTP
jgi:hypothetical protein